MKKPFSLAVIITVVSIIIGFSFSPSLTFAQESMTTPAQTTQSPSTTDPASTDSNSASSSSNSVGTTGQTPQPSSSNVVVQTTTFEGEITKIDGQKMTVKGDNETKEFTIPTNIRIKRDTNSTDYSSLKVGDRATITQASNGDALSVDAVSGKLIDTSKIAIPALIIVILLLLLIWYFLRRSKQGQIKTSTTQMH